MDRRTVIHAVVFVTGAVTLALELTSSRILTPYVGGSLYVWTAILSITLLALAAGYRLGSGWSQRADRDRLFVRIPVLAALVLAAVAVLYPALLPTLAYGDPLGGAFLGGLLVLGPALVLLSAMGPLAIALTATPEGDRGAGTVFAVSTVGSVLGAPMAAFGLLPFMSPAAVLLVLAAALAAVSLAILLLLVRDRPTLAGLLPASALAIGGAGLLVVDAPPAVELGDTTATHRETARGPHGSIVVVDLTHATLPGSVRLYLAENQVQSARAEGLPGEALRYVAIAKTLLADMVAQDGRILLLGLAGGTLASDLAETGRQVQAVEIDPVAVGVAERWFGLDTARVPVVVGDARRVLSDGCAKPFDAIVFDTFSGLTVPDHLVTVEAFAAAGRCLAPDGAVIVNAIIPPLDTRPSRRFMAAVAKGVGSGGLTVYQDPAMPGEVGNRILVADRAARQPPELSFDAYPISYFNRVALDIAPLRVPAAELADVPPLSDAANDFALRMAGATLRMSHFPIPPAWH